MSANQEAQIQARLDAATSVPWHAWDRGIGWEVHVGPAPSGAGEYPHRGCFTLNGEFRETFRQADAELIASAPKDLAYLMKRVKDLEQAARDERNAKQCPQCGNYCLYDGWQHVHASGIGIGSCKPGDSNE